MLITWDIQKAKTKLTKHGVSFDEAVTVLSNPLTLLNQNDHPSADRWEYLGHSVKRRLLMVVTVENKIDEIRIISARKATTYERKKYEEGERI